jgi:glutamate synthase (NADPH) small chain
VEFHWLASPVEIIDDGHRNVRAVRCIRMALGEPDSSGRRRPVPEPGSEFEIEADMVVYAIGTNANPIIGQTSQAEARQARLHCDGRGSRRPPFQVSLRVGTS